MKKILMMAVALSVFCACDDSDDPQIDPIPDAVSVASSTTTVSSRGGEIPVIVTSSGEWTLVGSCDWATPSLTEGKDGDIVRFKVDPNETDTDRTVEYRFVAGKAEATFTLTSLHKTNEEDAIEIAPESETLGMDGGSVEVIVISSGHWTLEGGESWATPSITEGEDGDIVKFTVETNKSTEDRSALFTFTRGTATTSFTLTQKGGELTILELVSESDVILPKEAAQVEVLLSTNISYRDLTYSIPEPAREWLTHTITLLGDDGKGAKMIFSVAENTTFDSRTAVVTISASDEKTVEVTFTQAPILHLDVPADNYTVEQNGGKIEIPVDANVEYDVIVSSGDESWIVYKGLVDGKETFDIAAGEGFRRGKVTFQQKDGDLSVCVDIVQKGSSLINVAADMTENWAWPEWNEQSPVKDMTAFTFEALVCRTASKGPNSLSAIMGVEDLFLVRLGDVNVPEDQIQICYMKNIWGSASKLSNESMRLPNLNQWYHIAVTFAEKNIVVYINGQNVGSATTNVTKFDFSVLHNDESGRNPKRCFWVGYAFESKRYFPGYMSEVRIWNRALTAEEINAGNHFYTVDAASKGLVSYWKFDDGQGSTVKDYTSYGNDLTANKEMKWVPVALPR